MSKNISITKPRGFIALASAVVISAMLLVVVVAGSASGFYERGVILDAELKARSRAAADACAERAYLYLESVGYAGGTYSLNSLDECKVGDIEASGAQVSFKVQATSGKTAVTNLRISYDPPSHRAVSKEEIPNY